MIIAFLVNMLKIPLPDMQDVPVGFPNRHFAHEPGLGIAPVPCLV